MSLRVAGVFVLAVLAGLTLAAATTWAVPAGQVVGAGYDSYGELGNGEGNEFVTGLETLPFWGPVLATQAAASEYNSYVRLANGTVEASGYNEYGDDGTGSTSGAQYLPKVIPGLTGVSEVNAGYDYFGLALLSDGTVDGWGYGYYGQLGNGKKEAAAEEDSPTPIPGLEHVTQVVAGCYYGMALLANGTVESWGWGSDGELGNGGTSETATPAVIPGLTNVVAIASGCVTSYALLASGKVMAWGQGKNGELGNGTNTEKQPTPVEVSGLEGAMEISAGYYSGYARLANGTVKAWGYNKTAELGDGTAIEHNEPELIPGLTGVMRIVAASQAAYAIITDGTVTAGVTATTPNWQTARRKQRPKPKTPTPIAGLTNVLSIAKGDYDYTLLAIEGASSTLSASNLAFANQVQGTESAAQVVTLKNDGPAPLAVSANTLTAAGSFLKTADTCQGQTIAAGATCSISLVFKPSATGNQSASLTLSTSATNVLPAVALSGTGVAAPAPISPPAPLPPGVPSLGTLALSPSTFRAAPSGASAVAASVSTGTFVVYTDSQAATTTFVVEQKSSAIKSHGKCGAAPKHTKKGGQPCTFYKQLGSFTHADAVGTNALRFTGRVGGHTLKAGSYRLSASAHSAGGTSKTQTVAFKIGR